LTLSELVLEKFEKNAKALRGNVERAKWFWRVRQSEGERYEHT
jgi:hypothetical protein